MSTSIPKIHQPAFDLTQYIRQDNSFNKMPVELLLECLFKLDLRSLLNFSQLSKECYVTAMNPVIWATVAKALNLKISPSVNKAMCQEGYELKKAFDKTVSLLELDKKLGAEICQKINTMPTWCGTIKYSDDNENYLSLSQFAEHQIKDEQDHFFKTVIDNDLYLILITSNRWSSKVIWFNSAFSINSVNQKEYLYWEYSIGPSTGFYINTSENEKAKQLECQEGWASMKNELSCTLNVKFVATNLQEHSIDAITQWMLTRMT